MQRSRRCEFVCVPVHRWQATIGTWDVIGPLCPCQTAQVSDEDVRTAAAFCVSFGKIPVVTPSSSFSSLGVSGFVSVYHWALATRLVATHNLSPAWLDKCLVKAGFTKGPFAVMEEVSALCLNASFALRSFWLLATFVAT